MPGVWLWARIAIFAIIASFQLHFVVRAFFITNSWDAGERSDAQRAADVAWIRRRGLMLAAAIVVWGLSFTFWPVR